MSKELIERLRAEGDSLKQPSGWSTLRKLQYEAADALEAREHELAAAQAKVKELEPPYTIEQFKIVMQNTFIPVDERKKQLFCALHSALEFPDGYRPEQPKQRIAAGQVPPCVPQPMTADSHKDGATLAGSRRTEEDCHKPSSTLEQTVPAAPTSKGGDAMTGCCTKDHDCGEHNLFCQAPACEYGRARAMLHDSVTNALPPVPSAWHGKAGSECEEYRILRPASEKLKKGSDEHRGCAIAPERQVEKLQREVTQLQKAIENSAKLWVDQADELLKLQRENAELRTELHIAAGLISTLPQFADKHPEEALQFIRDAARKEG